MDNLKKSRQSTIDRKDQTRDDLFLVPLNSRIEDKLKDEYLDLTVLESWLGMPDQEGTKDRDKKHMALFLDKSTQGHLPRLREIRLADCWPGGVPLVLYLQADHVSSNGGHCYPSRTCIDSLISHNTLDNYSASSVEWHEITLGRDSAIKQKYVQDWVAEKLKEDQDKFPGQFVSFALENMNIPDGMLEKMIEAREEWCDNSEPLKVKVPNVKEPNSKVTEVPARVIFGNGSSWVVSIRFDVSIVTQKGVKYYLFNLKPLTDKEFEILSSLPRLLGHNVINDCYDLETFIGYVYRIKIKLSPCLEISSLGVAAGLRPMRPDPFISNLQVMGGLLNTQVSKVDQKSALEWKDLPTEFKIYYIGKVLTGHTNGMVLMSLLMRNIFPDMDVVCSTLELRQRDMVTWFSWMVGECLRATKVQYRLSRQAKTRIDLLLSLREMERPSFFRYEMKRTPTDLLTKLTSLIPDWSTVVNGGARDIHSVWAAFTDQYQILKEIHLIIQNPNIYPNFSHDVDHDFIKAVTFNRGTERDDVYRPASVPGLLPRFSLVDKVMDINLDKLTNDEITELVTQSNQHKASGILECARLSDIRQGQFIYSLLDKLSTLDLNDPAYSFWHEKVTLYERLRLMHQFLHDSPAAVVPHLEQEITSRERNVIQLEESTRKKDEVVVENRMKREELYAANNSRSQLSAQSRAAVQQKVYRRVPGDHANRNKKWSKSKKKMYKEQMSRADYIPKAEWKRLGKLGQQPARSKTNSSGAAKGFDLRDVLKNKEKEVVDHDSTETQQQDDPMEGTSTGFTVQHTRENRSPARVVSQIHVPGRYSPRGSPERSRLRHSEDQEYREVRTVRYVERSPSFSRERASSRQRSPLQGYARRDRAHARSRSPVTRMRYYSPRPNRISRSNQDSQTEEDYSPKRNSLRFSY